MTEYVVKNQKRLRCGITTGTCAAAAAAAAAETLLLGTKRNSVSLTVPKGGNINVPVCMVMCTEDCAEYVVIKDSGDDPDVTNNAEISARVEKTEKSNISGTVFESNVYKGLFLDGGTGVGRVTKKGLEQDVGFAAINSVPRKMIFDAVGAVSTLSDYKGSLIVTVSVPEGERLAKKTFNPKLGIEGGISILGTSGIIEPMSERAIVDTVEAEIRQLSVLGNKSIILTPGNYGRGYAADYLKLDLSKSVKCSNYIGEAVDLAAAYGFENLLIVGNMGKLVKTAAGIMNTHSRTADARAEIFAVHAVLQGAGQETAVKIMNCINTDEMLGLLDEHGLKDAVVESICGKIYEHFKSRIGSSMKFGVVLFSERFGYLGQTDGAEEVIERLGLELGG